MVNSAPALHAMEWPSPLHWGGLNSDTPGSSVENSHSRDGRDMQRTVALASRVRNFPVRVSTAVAPTTREPCRPPSESKLVAMVRSNTRTPSRLHSPWSADLKVVPQTRRVNLFW
jgi:hypothetical protein